jgi:hypothetical protein
MSQFLVLHSLMSLILCRRVPIAEGTQMNFNPPITLNVQLGAFPTNF